MILLLLMSPDLVDKAMLNFVKRLFCVYQASKVYLMNLYFGHPSLLPPPPSTSPLPSPSTSPLPLLYPSVLTRTHYVAQAGPELQILLPQQAVYATTSGLFGVFFVFVFLRKNLTQCLTQGK